jgi:hypothetical protein
LTVALLTKKQESRSARDGFFVGLQYGGTSGSEEKHCASAFGLQKLLKKITGYCSKIKSLLHLQSFLQGDLCLLQR